MSVYVLVNHKGSKSGRVEMGQIMLLYKYLFVSVCATNDSFFYERNVHECTEKLIKMGEL